MSEAVIRASGLHKRFIERSGETPLDVHVLQGVDLQVERGEAVAVVGASGSGKSTLLHVMGGLESPSEGAVLLGGRDFASMTPAQQGDWRNQPPGLRLPVPPPAARVQRARQRRDADAHSPARHDHRPPARP